MEVMMDTLEFFEWLLPSKGHIVLGVPETNEHGRSWWKNRKFATIAKAASEAVKLDANSEVYVAINSFGDWYKDKQDRFRIRTQDNVAWCKSLYDDYDVDANDPKKYKNKKEAIADVAKLASALRLTPSVIDSGGGYHTYFHLDEEVDKATWIELATLKRDITTFLNMKIDRAVDLDSARVLRPVGTHNKKYGTPIPVKMLKQGKRYSVEHLRSTMLKFIEDNNIQRAVKKGGFGDFVEYGEKLDRNQAREAVMNGKEWHNNMLKLVASWVTKGNTVAEIHGLAKDLILEGYSEEDTRAEVQKMIDGARSKGFCPPEIEPSVAQNAAAAGDDDDDGKQTSNATVIEGQTIPYWNNQMFRWNGVALSRAYTDDDGAVSWKPFCKSFVYPINRIKDSEGTWVIHWRAKGKNGSWREFFMPTSELAIPAQMSETFSSHEVFLTRTRNARNDMAEFAETLIETLQRFRVETKTYGQFGWTEDRKGFVLGTKMITEKGSQEVLCDPNVPTDVAVDFGRKGTLEEWISNIDTLYNRKDAEPFQFALCHSMGSVLVELMGSSNWHGLPLAFTGHGGTGKSTAAKIACGFYGNPEYMERQTGDQGATLNAVIKRIAIMGSVPLLLDEFSGRTSEELTRTGYALANGRDKERLSSSGRFATVGGQWFKNSFITSNDSILESIAKLPAGYKVEATQLRFFEVSLPQDYRTAVFPDITQEFVENHMDNVYGEACLPYIRFVIKHRDWVRRQLVAARIKFNPKSDDDNKERFYRDTIVTALVAGKIAEKIGLVSFDINAMGRWASEQVIKMRESRREVNTSVQEHLAAFIATLHGRLIVTKRLGSANTTKEDTSMPLRSVPAGRLCTEDKKAFITVKSMTDWCKENSVTPASIREELDNAGYLIMQPTGEPNKRMYIGQGSTIPSGMARCYELNYHKLMDGVGVGLATTPIVEDVEKKPPTEDVSGAV